MHKIMDIYSVLYESFGAQGWWPVTPSCCTNSQFKPVYGIKTKTDKHRLEIIMGAILTQNTSWKNAEKAIEALNRHRMIDIGRILKSDMGALARLIKPSGYYNQKAERLKIIAFFLKNNPFSKLKSIKTEKLRKMLLSLKGIGPETADSILLYAFERPIFVIDAYTKRVFEALGYNAQAYDEWQRLFMNSLPRDAQLFNEYHALLVELAKNYCRKAPICSECFIRRFCSKKIK